MDIPRGTRTQASKKGKLGPVGALKASRMRKSCISQNTKPFLEFATAWNPSHHKLTIPCVNAQDRWVSEISGFRNILIHNVFVFIVYTPIQMN